MFCSFFWLCVFVFSLKQTHKFITTILVDGKLEDELTNHHQVKYSTDDPIDKKYNASTAIRIIVAFLGDVT